MTAKDAARLLRSLAAEVAEIRRDMVEPARLQLGAARHHLDQMPALPKVVAL